MSKVIKVYADDEVQQCVAILKYLDARASESDTLKSLPIKAVKKLPIAVRQKAIAELQEKGEWKW